MLAATALTADVLAARIAILLQARNGLVLDVLIRAGGDVPLRYVERMRRRLVEMRTHARMARTLDEIRRGAESSAHASNPLTSRPAIVAASAELLEVARLLRRPRVSVAGAARVRVLLSAADSPLGRDGFALREELHRIRRRAAGCR